MMELVAEANREMIASSLKTITGHVSSIAGWTGSVISALRADIREDGAGPRPIPWRSAPR